MASIAGTTISLDGIGHLVADSKLRVPVYQRSFSWTAEEIDELLGDLWSLSVMVKASIFSDRSS